MNEDLEIQLLLQIVKGGKAPALSPPFDNGRLMDLALRHRVGYYLMQYAQQHKELFSPQQITGLDERCRQSALRSLRQLSEVKRIAEALTRERIGFACIKGLQLSRMVYGREALKESVDIDIMLTDSGDLMKVHDLLNSIGYTRSNLNQYKGRLKRRIFLIAKREIHYFSRETRCAIDLHVRPGANTYLTTRYFNGFLSTLKTDDLEGTTVPVLPDEAYLAYLCYHGSLHRYSRLAWLLDIRAFLKVKSSTLDYSKLMHTARQIHAERHVCLTFLLLEKYFNDQIPLYISELQAFRQMCGTKRMKYLVSVCTAALGRDYDYEMTLRARIEKVIFMMLLVDSLASRIDWLYGIGMRVLAKIWAVKI